MRGSPEHSKLQIILFANLKNKLIIFSVQRATLGSKKWSLILKTFFYFLILTTSMSLADIGKSLKKKDLIQ